MGKETKIQLYKLYRLVRPCTIIKNKPLTEEGNTKQQSYMVCPPKSCFCHHSTICDYGGLY